MIGTFEVHDGLYILSHKHILSSSDEFVIATHINNDSTAFDVWHHRLGHPSSTITHKIYTQFPFHKNKQTFHL